jgi:rod shape-determining protein MreC
MQNRSRPRSLVLIIVLLALSALVVLFNFVSQSPIGQGPLSVVIAPIQSVFNEAGRAINGLFRTTGELTDVRARAEILQKQVAELSAENIRLREFQAELKQYRDLYKFANDNPTFDVIGADVTGIADTVLCKNRQPASPNAGKCANVIAGDSSPFIRYVTINAGSRDGIAVGMPVVAGGIALIGRVGEVGFASSQVQLLNDPTSFGNVRVVESRANGTVAGTSEGLLQLQNVPQTDPLKPGDLIVTSGLGGTLPAALPIGVVERITSRDLETQQTAIVRAGVNFDELETVLIITAQRAANEVPTPTPAAP